MSKPRKKLADILNGGNNDIGIIWKSTAAAGEDSPLPRGEYICHAINGELFNAGTGTPGYEVTFKVLEGTHAGRLIWHRLWLTEAAMPRAKRDLTKLGITTPEQMDVPLPQGIRCRVVAVVRKDDDGIEKNEVRRLEVIGTDPPPPNPFAPADSPAPDEPPPQDADVSTTPSDGVAPF